ncbi:MAG: triphosphoribosyl-dephospho-CoA synthase [Bacillota bacterium]
MTTADNILKAREERAKKISNLINNNKQIVSIKANMPGNNKNSYLAYLIINSFSFNTLDIEIKNSYFHESADGPFYLLEISSNDLEKTKNKLMDFENNWPLGRFLDLDLYSKTKHFSRKQKRQCFFCNEVAINCIRKGKHSVEEVYKYIESKTLDYYKDLLLNYIGESFSLELNLDPKFGLVTKKSQGSHKDMDYLLMLKAKEAILPYFIEIFLEVCKSKESLADILSKVKKIGIKAENAMFSATNGINAYKGIIFHLGLIITTYSYLISRQTDMTFREIIQHLAKLFFKRYKNLNTFGEFAYKNFSVSGARGEAINGYEHVSKALKVLKDLSKASLLKTLIYLIAEVEDTTLLKRAKTYNYYLSIKTKFKKLEIKEVSLKNLTQYCIEHNLSFGGSADLLIVTIFIKKIMVICDKINL